MRVHAIMHVPVEGPGRIASWAAERGHQLTTSLALTEEFPAPEDVGLVCVMGGPMDADDHVRSPWLAPEKAWLREIIDARVPVLGVCLGAQILAEVLGGRVARNPVLEIGWHGLELTDAGRESTLFGDWPARTTVAQWHGDTYELPAGIENCASSDAAANQAFDFEGRVAGVQFHLEWDAELIRTVTREFAGDIERGGPFVQSAEEFVGASSAHVEACGTMLWNLLDSLTGDRG